MSGPSSKRLHHARERVQGRSIGGESKTSVPIVDHPDVRRMLLTMKAYVEAMRSLLYLTAAEGDHLEHADSEERRKLASDRLALLTPVVKAWCTDVGVEIASLGVQVHGGMGYIEETGAAQSCATRESHRYTRAPTASRPSISCSKIPLENGAVVAGVIGEMTAELATMEGHDQLAGFRGAVGRHPGSGRDLEMARRAARRRRSPGGAGRCIAISEAVRDRPRWLAHGPHRGRRTQRASRLRIHLSWRRS